jgi:hypothetical protein
LNYKRNCDRFGMFFIPLVDPSRPWMIDGIPDIDTVEVVRELKLTATRPRKPQPERQEEEDETRYPLGEAPTWKQIAGSLLGDPTILIPRWEDRSDCERFSDCQPGSVESIAVDIFICFTCHIWILLNPTWRTRPEIPINPMMLNAALRCWSVDAILGEVLETTFKPCHSGLDAGPGRPSLSFSQRRNMYFPEDDSTRLTKIWRRFAESPGYMFKYYECRNDLDTESKRSLDECLEELLMLCQCLPDSSRSKSGGWIWRVEKKKIVVLTNPDYYRLRRIGQEPSAGGKKRAQGIRAAPAHRNAKSTAVAMMVHEDIPEDVAQKAYQVTRSYQTRRSAKSKNRRIPPQRQRNLVEKDAEDSDDDDEGNGDGDGNGNDEGNACEGDNCEGDDEEEKDGGEGDDEDSDLRSQDGDDDDFLG